MNLHTYFQSNPHYSLHKPRPITTPNFTKTHITTNSNFPVSVHLPSTYVRSISIDSFNNKTCPTQFRYSVCLSDVCVFPINCKDSRSVRDAKPERSSKLRAQKATKQERQKSGRFQTEKRNDNEGKAPRSKQNEIRTIFHCSSRQRKRPLSRQEQQNVGKNGTGQFSEIRSLVYNSRLLPTAHIRVSVRRRAPSECLIV